MGYQKNMLIRTSLSDVGDERVHGSYCASPDMIIHSPVNNPQEVFGSNYGSDPNEKIDQSSKTNMIYTRVKSMNAGALKGYIRLYRANASLFMNTDQWKNNKLKTPQNMEYTVVTTSKNGDIAVGNDIFVVDGTQPNFCMVGIVSSSKEETVPNKFNTYSDFTTWVHGNRCVAVRNFSLTSSGVKNDYESLYFFANPESKARLGSILVEASGLPKGTIFGLENTSLGMKKESTFDPDSLITKQVTDSAFIEAGFQGYVKIYARLPKGQVWPASASLTTSFFISADPQEEMIRFALPAKEVLLDISRLDTLGTNNAVGKLVKVGFCETKFV